MKMRTLRTICAVARRWHDPTMRFILLTLIAKRLVPDYRFKRPPLQWWHDEEFNLYLERFNLLDSVNTDRRWMLYQLLRLIEDVPGDTAECGVFRGSTSYLICRDNERNKAHERWHYAFDSFEGLSQPTGADGAYWSGGNLACGLDDVKATLADVSKVERDFRMEGRRLTMVLVSTVKHPIPKRAQAQPQDEEPTQAATKEPVAEKPPASSATATAPAAPQAAAPEDLAPPPQQAQAPPPAM